MSAPARSTLPAAVATARTVRREIELHAPEHPNPRLCIFSHYDPEGVVDPHVLHYLAELARVAEILFVTSCPDLPAADLHALGRYCTRVIFRENLGRDFGGYCVGLAHAGDLAGRFEVILANDSVYGPLTDLAAVVAEMQFRDVDLWGITESWENGHHLQSYFLALRRSFFASAPCRAFWEQFSFPTARDDVIVQGELAFSQVACQAGFRLAAFCDYRKVRDFVTRYWPHHPGCKACSSTRRITAGGCWSASSAARSSRSSCSATTPCRSATWPAGSSSWRDARPTPCG